MERLLTRLTRIVLTAALLGTTSAQASNDANEFQFTADISYANASGLQSWTDDGLGKLRVSDGTSVGVARAFLGVERRLLPTLTAHMAVDAYDDDLGPSISPTEAFLAWRPVPRSANKYRLRGGFFYPLLSLENSGPGWSSPYTRSSSAINSWIAEEVRTLGVEVSVQRKPLALNGQHEFLAYGAMFYGNDPAGTVIAWRGWSIHDRQSRPGDKLPLPPLPVIQPGARISHHQDTVEPFEEIDGKAGFYAGLEWRAGQRLRVRLTRYDNRGDPEAARTGQYAWDTSFTNLGVQLNLPYEIDVIGQWMGGKTDMGPEENGAYLIDTNFVASFLLVSKAFGESRVSARYDDFEVTEDDQFPLDDNNDSGHAWTVSLRHRIADPISVFAEFTTLSGDHYARSYYGAETRTRERLLEVGVTVQLGRR